MYKKHCEINTPELTQEIWRYMDLWKFLDIIDNSRMYLSIYEKLNDPNRTSTKCTEVSFSSKIVRIILVYETNALL